MFEYKVIDNFIPHQTQEEIKEVLLDPSYNYPWFYNPDITYGNNSKAKNPAFSSIIKPHNPLIQNFASIAAKEAGLSMNYVFQARAFLQLPLNPTFIKTSIDALHIDLDIPHLVALYYVIDSDGDTLLSNKKHQYNEQIKTDLQLDDFGVLTKVTPKQGRAVIFDGSIYHTAEQPSNHVRCVINVDIVCGDQYGKLLCVGECTNEYKL